MCVLSIKVPIRKKSGNLFNDPCIIIMNKYILDFIYLIPWKFVCDLRFHEVLQTTIIRQITKENEEIEKYRKIQSKTVRIFIYKRKYKRVEW